MPATTPRKRPQPRMRPNSYLKWPMVALVQITRHESCDSYSAAIARYLLHPSAADSGPVFKESLGCATEVAGHRNFENPCGIIKVSASPIPRKQSMPHYSVTPLHMHWHGGKEGGGMVRSTTPAHRNPGHYDTKRGLPSLPCTRKAHSSCLVPYLLLPLSNRTYLKKSL